MYQDSAEYAREKINNLLIAVSNIAMFLPHFFSVRQLMQSLFKPWKNISSPRPKGGENLNDWFSRFMFNIISSGMGFMMRVSLLGAYVFVLVAYVFMLPGLMAIYLVSIPLRYSLYRVQKPEDVRKTELRKQFLETRLIDGKNEESVSAWFEWYYNNYIHTKPWWSLSRLMSIPPMARDWSYGYTPSLDQYGEEITLAKPHYHLLVDRQTEIAAMEQILSKSQEHNCLIVGEEGVGKHTIVEGLAKKIYEGKCAAVLNFRRIIKLDMEKIISGSTDFSQKENLLKNILTEAQDAGNIIILIDHIESYIVSGENSIDLSQIIADFARSDRLQFIGISSSSAYQRHISQHEKINLLFQKIDVAEISAQSALLIVLSTIFDFEKRLKILIPYETAKESVDKSNFYITDTPFPEKALQLLDEACVYATQTLKAQKVLPDMVDAVLTAKTHIPVVLDATTKDKLLNLETLLKSKIVEQDEGIEMLASTLRKSLVAHENRRKPLASLLFLGPTGVGKTETAKAIAEVFFGGADHMIRLDMALFQNKNDIPTLIGSVATGEPGQLTAQIHHKPYAVLLIDEIEKADHDLLNIFLTMLDEGYYTDGFGKRVDCKNLIIIATSNAGADMIFQLIQETQHLDKNTLLNHLVEHKIFLPEFINRFDGIALYKPLTKQGVSEIARRTLSNIADIIFHEHEARVTFSDEFIQAMVEKGYDPAFGARNLTRIVRDEVEDKMAKLILENKLAKGDTITF